MAEMGTTGRYNTNNQHCNDRKTNLHNISEDSNSLFSKSTSSITLNTIRSECPQEHLVTLNMLISSGAGLESIKKSVSGWSLETSNRNQDS